MSNQKRLRSNATALTTEQKQKLIEEAEITDDMDQKLAEEKMQKALDNKMKKELDKLSLTLVQCLMMFLLKY